MKARLSLILCLVLTVISQYAYAGGGGAGTPSVGQTAPEISLSNTEGKTIRLSDFRGKVVLVDFWASWCGPCRSENPNVVKNYNKYKDSKSSKGTGFVVFSISLDVTQDKWLKAIKSDRLSWTSHGCDLAGWHSAAAKTYGVSQIPMNFLIDGNGKILAKDLRGDDLSAYLEGIFGK